MATTNPRHLVTVNYRPRKFSLRQSLVQAPRNKISHLQYVTRAAYCTPQCTLDIGSSEYSTLFIEADLELLPNSAHITLFIEDSNMSVEEPFNHQRLLEQHVAKRTGTGQDAVASETILHTWVLSKVTEERHLLQKIHLPRFLGTLNSTASANARRLLSRSLPPGLIPFRT